MRTYRKRCMSGTDLLKFMEHECSVKSPSGCLEWTRSLLWDGYGSIRYLGKMHRVHRLAYKLRHGDIPETTVVRHTCDNPKCFADDHLLLGSIQDNTDDMMKRHRRSSPLGTSHGMARLNLAGVKYIRSNPQLSNYKLAALLGVGVSTVHNVRKGNTWKHVLPPSGAENKG